MKIYLILLLAFASCSSPSYKDSKTDPGNATGIDSLISKNLETCDCSSSMQKKEISLDTSYPLIICSYEKLTLDTAVLISGFYIGSCDPKKDIVDQRLDEIHKYWLSVKPDTISISSTHPVLAGNSWDYKLIPLEKKIITLEKGTLKNSQEFIFLPPDLTSNQKDSILSFISYLEGNRNSNPKRVFPGDENAIIVLFMGVIHDVGKSREVWRSLREDFLLDGAIAETYGEMHYELITNSYKPTP